MAEMTNARPDTSDMQAVHAVFRQALASAPTFVDSTNGDDERRALVGNYYDNVIAFLEVHHDGEEALVFPLLVERAPEHRAVVDKAAVDHHTVLGQIGTVKDRVGVWSSKGDEEAAPVVESLGALEAILCPHLDEEEEVIVPLAADHLTAEEWGMLPGHGFGHFEGDKIWLILGLIRENMTRDQRDSMLSHMPPPARQMWETTGESSFIELIAQVRQTG